MLETNFLKYSVKDFLLDQSFCYWVISGDAGKWDDLLEQYPDKRMIAETARTQLLQWQRHLQEDVLWQDKEEVWDMITKSVYRISHEENKAG